MSNRTGLSPIQFLDSYLDSCREALRFLSTNVPLRYISVIVLFRRPCQQISRVKNLTVLGLKPLPPFKPLKRRAALETYPFRKTSN